jgi:hypothetical protein
MAASPEVLLVFWEDDDDIEYALPVGDADAGGSSGLAAASSLTPLFVHWAPTIGRWYAVVGDGATETGIWENTEATPFDGAWEEVYTVASVIDVRSIATNGTTFLAVCADGSVVASDDLLTFTRTTGLADSFDHVVWHADSASFYACALNGDVPSLVVFDDTGTESGSVAAIALETPGDGHHGGVCVDTDGGLLWLYALHEGAAEWQNLGQMRAAYWPQGTDPLTENPVDVVVANNTGDMGTSGDIGWLPGASGRAHLVYHANDGAFYALGLEVGGSLPVFLAHSKVLGA